MKDEAVRNGWGGLVVIVGNATGITNVGRVSHLPLTGIVGIALLSEDLLLTNGGEMTILKGEGEGEALEKKLEEGSQVIVGDPS